ncbi:uncharacterized protein LOC116805758 [Drosophila grimshawi]|uniref:uncharacterized protein LOC116805758 n=1 Tax=Drosophila grimshawi TaxID=7222 RepID=UPI000C871612|nr:uncharacterized protein LOC116805758 [Drosophila grimshawi]
MLKSYQLVLGIALVFACFNLETSSFARNFNAIHHRQNSTYMKPAVNYQPGPGFNNTRPNYGAYNLQPLQSSPPQGFQYQSPLAPQPGSGYNNNNNIFAPQPVYGGVFPNGTARFNQTQAGRPNGTYPYMNLFKFW